MSEAATEDPPALKEVQEAQKDEQKVEVKQEDGGEIEGCASAAPEGAQISPLEEKIIRQVEFYFGDRNLPKDKFLLQAVASNDDGWVPIATLLTFNRLKALSSDKGLIATALRKTTKKIIQVSDDGESVRRHPDNPATEVLSLEQRKQIRGKTLYVKGFEEETKLDEIQEFLEKYGKTVYIHMRRTGPPDKKFKGSVFVEFEEEGDAEKFLSADAIKFKDTQVIKESKEAYFKRKSEERKKIKEDKRIEEQQKMEEARKKKRQQQPKTPSGCVLHFSGCGPNTTREQLKEVFQEFATVAFIDFDKGDTEGYVRFQEEGGAGRAMEGLKQQAGDGTTQLCGADTKTRVLEGEEEEGYWKKVQESKMSSRKGGRKQGWKRSSFGRKRKQKVSEGDSAEEPATKQVKSENSGNLEED